MKKGTLIPEIVLFILSIVLIFGVKYVFGACPMTEEGTYMSCHWAQEAVFSVALIMLILSLCSIAARKNMYLQTGFLGALIPCAVIAILIPGNFISLCMLSDMTCRSIMRPSVILINVLILCVADAAIIINLRKSN